MANGERRTLPCAARIDKTCIPSDLKLRGSSASFYAFFPGYYAISRILGNFESVIRASLSVLFSAGLFFGRLKHRAPIGGFQFSSTIKHSVYNSPCFSLDIRVSIKVSDCFKNLQNSLMVLVERRQLYPGLIEWKLGWRKVVFDQCAIFVICSTNVSGILFQ